MTSFDSDQNMLELIKLNSINFEQILSSNAHPTKCK